VDRTPAPSLLPILRSQQQAEILTLLLGDPDLELSLGRGEALERRLGERTDLGGELRRDGVLHRHVRSLTTRRPQPLTEPQRFGCHPVGVASRHERPSASPASKPAVAVSKRLFARASTSSAPAAAVI
jgi:hypothetical protein